jgi:hypothetical protein
MPLGTCDSKDEAMRFRDLIIATVPVRDRFMPIDAQALDDLK